MAKTERRERLSPAHSGVVNPGRIVTRLRLLAKDLRAEGFPNGGDLAKEAADMIESMNTLLCDPDIVRKH